MSMKFSERSIAMALAEQFFNKKYLVVVPNCNWTGHECDLLVVTENLRVIDVEIKISRSDLKADAKKTSGGTVNALGITTLSDTTRWASQGSSIALMPSDSSDVNTRRAPGSIITSCQPTFGKTNCLPALGRRIPGFCCSVSPNMEAYPLSASDAQSLTAKQSL